MSSHGYSEKEMAEKPVDQDYTPVSLDYDPIERGLTLTVDNSPRHRNYNVVKAKLREQEAIYALEKVELRNEFQKRETELQTEIISLRSYKDELELKLVEAEKQKNELMLCHETTKKDLEALSSKCCELEGRLMESRSANETARFCTEKLLNDHEEEIQTLRMEFADVASGYQEAEKTLQKKIKEMEYQLELTHKEYEKRVSELAMHVKEKESVITEWEQKEQTRQDEILKEQASWKANVNDLNEQLLEMCASRDGMMAELEKCREEQKLSFKLMQDEQVASLLKWDEEKVAFTTKVEELQEQLKTSKVLREESACDLENCKIKYEDSMKVLKDTLVVIDGQNKELTNEVETIREQFNENNEFRKELTAKVDILLKQLNESRSEKQELLDSKLKLEEKLSNLTTKIEELTNDKGEEVRNLQEHVNTLQITMAKDAEEKEGQIVDLRMQLNNIETSTSETMARKDDEMLELSKQVQTLQSEYEILVQEKEELNKSLLDSKHDLVEKTAGCESSKSQITKLNLEVSRLINTVVNIKEENIELKTGLNQSLQKAEFFKQRSDELSDELAKLQCEKTEKETELQADIEEKQKIIEYFQAQSAAGSDKKKRRFFAGSPKKEKPSGEGSISTL
ncbi:unnamed protein product [Orchesella dallaii]|uniref:Uncharacterized protein n=1 Tax=Orchesella dallaii TaxID=48710 RepID=A0ABP1PWA7_9HEXA